MGDPWCWQTTTDYQAAGVRQELVGRGFKDVHASQGRSVSLVIVSEDEDRLGEITELLADHPDVIGGPVRLSTI